MKCIIESSPKIFASEEKVRIVDGSVHSVCSPRCVCVQTGFSHLCSNGLAAAVDLLHNVPEVDVNIPDKEGNTPLIFAAQAGKPPR